MDVKARGLAAVDGNKLAWNRTEWRSRFEFHINVWNSNPGVHKYLAPYRPVTTFSKVATNISGSPVWNLLGVILLAPRILRWCPNCWKIWELLFEPTKVRQTFQGRCRSAEQTTYRFRTAVQSSNICSHPLRRNLHDEGQQSSGAGWVGVGNRAAVKHEKLLRVINPCLITTTQLHVPSKCPASSEHNYTGWPAGFFNDLLYKSCCWSAHVLCTRLHGQPEWLMLLDQFCKRLWVAVMQLEASLLSLRTERLLTWEGI